VTVHQWARADITYLKQDYSVALPVKYTGAGGPERRFDFLVRQRPATKAELSAAAKVDRDKPTAHQEALLFAIRELTGEDAATALAARPAQGPPKLEVATWLSGVKAGRALAVDGNGRAHLAAGKQLLVKEGDERPTPWLDDARAMALALDGKGHLLAARAKSTEVLRIELDTQREKVFGRAPEGVTFHQPRRLVMDRHGGAYLADTGPADRPRERGAVYYISPKGTGTALDVGVARPRGLALSPDGQVLYVAGLGAQQVMAYPVESGAALGRGKVVCELAKPSAGSGGVADLAVGADGQLYVLTASRRVEVYTAAGARVVAAALPDVPVAAAFGGRGGKALYVLTRSGGVTVSLAR
jgi:gluconolactonase